MSESNESPKLFIPLIFWWRSLGVKCEIEQILLDKYQIVDNEEWLNTVIEPPSCTCDRNMGSEIYSLWKQLNNLQNT
jgi:hypothetical protein